LTEITSSLDRVDHPTAAMAFEGIHNCGEYRAVREYHVAHGTDVLQESTWYYAARRLLRERNDRWIVDRRSNTVRHFDRSIETFCRRRHRVGVRTDTDHLGGWIDDRSEHGTERIRTSRHRHRGLGR
jgi:hypothetical protein